MSNKSPGSIVLHRSVLSAAIGLAVCSGAWAQQAQEAKLPTVTVTGTAERNYAPTDASSATRTSTPVKETPVTVQVVDESVIRDRAITSPRELAGVVAGVQPVIGYGNTASQWFVIRGFSTAGVNYRDGYRSAVSGCRGAEGGGVAVRREGSGAARPGTPER
jgi:outer membrane receptor protein involved in Fe transport